MSIEVDGVTGLVTLQGDTSLSGSGTMQVERVKALNERMTQMLPAPNSRQGEAAAVTPEPGKSSGNPPRRRIRSTSAMSASDDSLSNHSDDSGHRSFGVVLQREHHKRRRVDEEMQSPKESDKNTQQHVIGTSPMHLPAIPETRDLRNALASFHMHPCTSRDAPQGCGSGDGSNSRPTDENNKAQANKPPKGQKAIGDFFMRTSSPAAAAADGHGQACEPAFEPRHGSGPGESGARTVERSGSADKQDAATKAIAGAVETRRGDSAQGRKSTDFSGCAAHELQLLKAEKAVIAGELQKEKELRAKMHTENQEMQRSLAAMTAERDALLNRSRSDVVQYVDEISRRKAHQETLAKALARKEAELVTMRVQVNNHRLGTVVHKFSGSLTEGSQTFEPAFAYHQLQQRVNALDQQKSLVEQKRAHLKSSNRKSNAGHADQCMSDSAVLPSAYQDELLKIQHDALEKHRKELLAEKQKLDVDRMRHVREVKLQWDYNTSQYNLQCHQGVLFNRYVLLNLFGKGGFAEVFRAYDIETGTEVALKIHCLDSKVPQGGGQKEYVRRAIREVNILEPLRHQCIVRLHHVFEITDTSFAIVMEACKGGDLQTYLQERPNKQIPEKEARAIILQVFEGLVYLNSEHEMREPGPAGSTSKQRIIHYDLKPANILFDDLGMAKISDFGLSKLLRVDSGQSQLELTSPGAGTLYYQPPECQMPGPSGIPLISNKVDVWAAGVIFYEMLYGRRPFYTGVDQETIANSHLLLQHNALTFDAKPNVSQGAKDFIKRLLTYNHQLRPDVHEAAKDKYLAPFLKPRRPVSSLRPPGDPGHATPPSDHAAASMMAAAAMSDGNTFMVP